jgi:hypothetical protein
MIVRTIVYGEGGNNPSKPNNNIIEIKETEIPDPVEE